MHPCLDSTRTVPRTSQQTYTVLLTQLLVQGSRHDLPPDVTRGIEVGLAVDTTRGADHDDMCLETLVVKHATKSCLRQVGQC